MSNEQQQAAKAKNAKNMVLLQAELDYRETLPPRKRHNWQLDLSLADEWSKAFTVNTGLVHLDLSHNNLDSRELEAMKVGLDENHTILGIHIAGNEGTTDAMGFVHPLGADGKDEQQDVGISSLLTRIKPSLGMGCVKGKKMIEMRANSNCWICEGWS